MRITVSVPATSANLGPGFDCLGLALDWWNTITVEPAAKMQVKLRGESDGLPCDETNATLCAMRMLYRHIGEPLPPVRVTMTNRMPIGKGFGSSAAALVGGLVAANALAGTLLDEQELLELATGDEGHPDNVSAALFGGMTISVCDGTRVRTVRVLPPPAWRAVVYVPAHALATKLARKILPSKISRADAVFNIGRAALLAHAFAVGDPALLNVATQDRLHQPYREALIPGMLEMLQAAREAGATGAALSGAGPSLLALAPSPGTAGRVRRAWAERARELRWNGDARVVRLSARGAQVTRE